MAQSPISQPVITKPNAKTPAPTNGSQRPASGPQRKTEGTPFEFNDLRFPLNVGTTDKTLHWIKFIPTVQNKSGYNVKKAQNESGTQQLSRADSNRMNSGQLSREAGFFKTALGAAGGTAALMGGLGVLGAVEGLANADNAGEAIAGGVGGFAKGAITGAFAGAVINSIDLTRKTRRAAGSISLYMPDTVNQTVVNDYDQVSMTQALGNAGLVLQAGGSVTEGALKSAMSGDISFGQTTGSAGASELAG